jgi:hypothetical protein
MKSDNDVSVKQRPWIWSVYPFCVTLTSQVRSGSALLI